MAVQTEEKSIVLSSQPPVSAADDRDESFNRSEGWRIASQAFWRECVRWGGQGAIALLLLTVIGYAGYWSLSEMKSLPAFVQSMARPFIPVKAARESADIEAEHAAASLAEEKEHHHQMVKKHHRHIAFRQIAAKVQRQKVSLSGSDDPTGGRIIYSDGYNTQYRWDK